MLKKMEVVEMEMVSGGGDLAADCLIAAGAVTVVAVSDGTALILGGLAVAAGSAKLCYNDFKEPAPKSPSYTYTPTVHYNPDPQSPSVNRAMREKGAVAKQDAGTPATRNIKPGNAY